MSQNSDVREGALAEIISCHHLMKWSQVINYGCKLKLDHCTFLLLRM